VPPLQALLTLPTHQSRHEVQTPHPRHWDALRQAARIYLDTHSDEPAFENEPAFFERQIAPPLQSVGARTTQQITGLSRSYTRRMVAGHHVPHVKHWRALQQAVERA